MPEHDPHPKRHAHSGGHPHPARHPHPNPDPEPRRRMGVPMWGLVILAAIVLFVLFSAVHHA